MMTRKEEIMSLANYPVFTWTVQDVGNWLEETGFPKYRSTFEVNKIDGAALLLLTEADLKHDLNVKIFGDVKKLSSAISKLNCGGDHESSCLPLMLPNAVKGGVHDDNWGSLISPVPNVSDTCCIPEVSQRSFSYSSGSKDDSEDGYSESSPLRLSHCSLKSSIKSNGFATDLQPEYFKTALSLMYMLLAGFINNVIIVLIQNNIEEMEKYPPLPDIFLDNFPYVEWAKPLSEIMITILMCTNFVVFYFHKHRSIVFRRFTTLFGSVYFLRAVSVYITRLPVPSSLAYCTYKKYTDVWSVLYEAFVILRGGGLRIHGIRTCGDYMFSGHAAALTLLNFFLTEYTPRRFYFLHIVSWLLNVFGMFFILAAHGHYSVDVLIAFYISVRMFLCYHSLANNRALQQKDSMRTRIWFPLFGYFEANVNGIIPNEYSNPLSRKNLNFFWQNVTSLFPYIISLFPDCLRKVRCTFPDILLPVRILRRNCRFAF